MNFTEYIEETSKYQLKLYGVIQTLNKNCKPIINDLKKSGKQLLWRGTRKSRTKSIIRVTPRQDRYPKDTPEFIHNSLDDEFEKKFGWRPRSSGVFVTARKSDAKSYGDAYIFFPVGKYRYIYNPNIVDLFGEVDNDFAGYDDINDYISAQLEEWEYEWDYEYGEGNQGTWYYEGGDTGESQIDDAINAAAEAEGYDESDINSSDLEWVPDVELDDFIAEKKNDAINYFDTYFIDIVKQYRSDNLGLAIKKKVEIMFDCDSFYVVNDAFADDIQKYVLEGESMDFDPKQKQLGFEKSSKVRSKKMLKHPEFEKSWFELQDPMKTVMGRKGGKNYMKLLSKSHKGTQKPLMTKKRR